jgi:hypothetical protein
MIPPKKIQLSQMITQQFLVKESTYFRKFTLTRTSINDTKEEACRCQKWSCPHWNSHKVIRCGYISIVGWGGRYPSSSAGSFSFSTSTSPFSQCCRAYIHSEKWTLSAKTEYNKEIKTYTLINCCPIFF